MTTPYKSARLNLQLFDLRREPVLREAFGTFSKVRPFLAELRTMSGEAGFCQHLEAVVMGAPDADAVLRRRREALRAAARARANRSG